MHKCRPSLFAVATVVSFAAGAAAEASTVNFSVGPYSNVGASTADPGTNWNTIVINGSTSVDVNSDGSPSDVTLTTPSVNTYTTNSAAITLFNKYIYGSGSTATLNGVAPGSYELYLYGINAGYKNGAETGFSVASSGVGGSAGAPATVDATNSSTFEAGANYVEIPATVGAGGDTITVTYTQVANEADFDGLQLVAVPEPAFVGLLSLGAVGLLARKRRT